MIKLREEIEYWSRIGDPDPFRLALYRNAAAALTAQAAEIKRLREALRNLLDASERHIFSTECQRERDAALRAQVGETE